MTINNKFREKNTTYKIVSSSTLSRYRIHRGSKLSEMSSPFEINFSRISLFFFPSCQNRRGVRAFFFSFIFFFIFLFAAAKRTNDFRESGRLEAAYPTVLLVSSMCAHKSDKSFPLTVT